MGQMGHKLWATSDQTSFFIFLLLPADLPAVRIYNCNRAAAKLALHLQLCQASKSIYLCLHRCISAAPLGTYHASVYQSTNVYQCTSVYCTSVNCTSSSSRPLHQIGKIGATRSMQRGFLCWTDTINAERWCKNIHHLSLHHWRNTFQSRALTLRQSSVQTPFNVDIYVLSVPKLFSWFK